MIKQLFSGLCLACMLVACNQQQNKSEQHQPSEATDYHEAAHDGHAEEETIDASTLGGMWQVKVAATGQQDTVMNAAGFFYLGADGNFMNRTMAFAGVGRWQGRGPFIRINTGDILFEGKVLEVEGQKDQVRIEVLSPEPGTEFMMTRLKDSVPTATSKSIEALLKGFITALEENDRWAMVQYCVNLQVGQKLADSRTALMTNIDNPDYRNDLKATLNALLTQHLDDFKPMAQTAKAAKVSLDDWKNMCATDGMSDFLLCQLNPLNDIYMVETDALLIADVRIIKIGDVYKLGLRI